MAPPPADHSATPSSCAVAPVRATDNYYRNCPAIMSDGRAFTDYRPRGVQALQDIVPLHKSSYEFRQHLEKHGDGIVDNMRTSAYSMNNCGPCSSFKPAVGELAKEVCSPNACEFVQGAEDGIGLGREFGETMASKDAYNAFLAKKKAETEELQKPPCNAATDPFVEFDPFQNSSSWH